MGVGRAWGRASTGCGCSPRVASVSGINAQARRLQRSRAKGTPALASGGARSPPASLLRRSASETSLSPAAQEPGQDAMRYSLYESPHLLLLQGYSQQHVSPCRPTFLPVLAEHPLPPRGCPALGAMGWQSWTSLGLGPRLASLLSSSGPAGFWELPRLLGTLLPGTGWAPLWAG